MQVAKIHTCCKNCVFAVYNEKTQTGCKLGRIEKFQPDVIECKDGDAEFFVINRVCNTFHDKSSEWAGKGNGVETALNEARTKFAVIVYLGQGATEWKLEQTCKSIVAQEYLPFQVFILSNQDGIKSKDIHATAWSVLGNKVTWRMTIVPKTDSGRATKGNAVDSIVNSLPSKLKQSIGDYATYYTIFEDGFECPENFLSKIDHIINIEMKQFLFISPVDENGNGVVCHIMAHQQFGGNEKWFSDSGDSIEAISEKLQAMAETNNTEHMILDSKCL